MAANINVPTPDKIIQQTAIQSKVVATPFLFLAKRMPASAKWKEKTAIGDKKIFLLIIDIGIAVKKLTTMLQKYVLPERTCSFLPFSDKTDTAAPSRATIPAKICMGNRICIPSLPLNCCTHAPPLKCLL